MHKSLKIIYMGTPEFAVMPLKILIENNYNVCAVVTVPDKPAGRGQKLRESAVKQFAQNNNIPVLQPEKLRNLDFLEQLQSFNADLFIVVAFRMLPEVVWKMSSLGTFNLHASLLPQYRGAAPINWAIINGEQTTGVTTFFINKEIDTGNILFQQKVEINDNDDAGILHDKLMETGAQLVLDTVKSIEQEKIIPKQQENSDELKDAPKIQKEDCKINWDKPIKEVYNHIRGLSPYPAAFTYFKTNDAKVLIKIFKTEKEEVKEHLTPGTIITDEKTYLKVSTKDGYINVLELQQEGKKRLPVREFLMGFKNIAEYKAE